MVAVPRSARRRAVSGARRSGAGAQDDRRAVLVPLWLRDDLCDAPNCAGHRLVALWRRRTDGDGDSGRHLDRRGHAVRSGDVFRLSFGQTAVAGAADHHRIARYDVFVVAAAGRGRTLLVCRRRSGVSGSAYPRPLSGPLDSARRKSAVARGLAGGGIWLPRLHGPAIADHACDGRSMGHRRPAALADGAMPAPARALLSHRPVGGADVRPAW